MCYVQHIPVIPTSSLTGAPIITVHPNPDQSILAAGEMITLSCASIGNPRPSIAWAQNGEVLQANEPLFSVIFESPDQYSTQSRLTIGPAISNVTGTFQCHARGNHADGELVVVESNTTHIIFHCKSLLSLH